MKVYIVTSGCYSDYSIEAAFSTKKKAEKWMCGAVPNNYEIKELELDDFSNKPTACLSAQIKVATTEDFYMHKVDRYGTDPIDLRIKVIFSLYGNHTPKLVMFFGELLDEKTVHKILCEKRAQLIASNPEIKEGFYDRDTLLYLGEKK